METQIIKKLSGTEVINALVHSFKGMLEKDDRLAPHMSYAIVKWNIKLQVRTPQDIPSGFDRDLEAETAGEGVDPFDPDMKMDDPAEFEVTQEQDKAPNEIRHESLQPIPVLVTDEKGQTTEKYISYAEESEGKANLQKAKSAMQKPRAPKGGFGGSGYGT